MNELTMLTCGCQVTTTRDFLGRVTGTIAVRSDRCRRDDHVPGHTVLMPGRDNAGAAGTIEPGSR
jgi:hypothetical protein